MLARLWLLAMAAIAMGAGSASAASVNELSEARQLLRLVELIEAGARPSVDDVVEAYKEYVRLYQLQTDLAAHFNEKAKSDYEEKYQRIGRVLNSDGLRTITETLFVAFDALDMERALVVTERQRASVREAIEELTAH